MLPFKKGVFRLALRSGMPLVPVAIKGSFKAMPPSGLSLTFTPIYVTIGRPIETANLTDDDLEPLRHQAQSSIQALLDNP
jgi:1-acyl-sn-glycerol-3-phosphate acyltransferase